MSKCMVVLSGGQDSTTCAYWAKDNFDEVHCVTFDYNQRHRREIQAAQDIARMIGAASHEVVELGPVLQGRSPLTNPDAVLEQYEDFKQMDQVIGKRVELTFVPMRNALFLTLAANRAVCRNIDTLVTGVCEADNANYPDCRISFVKAQTGAIAEALGISFTITAPLIQSSKAQICQTMFGFGIDSFSALAFTHTAYDGQYPPVGRDHATILRAHGFEEAMLPDPLVLRAHAEGVMLLPQTANYQNADLCREILMHVEDRMCWLESRLV